MKSGIYQIKNCVNGNIYIGQTVNFKNRKSDHFKTLRGNKHFNDHFQKAWNKYGAENFDFKILEYVLVDNLDEAEQWYLDNLNPEYNICKIANSTRGYKHTEENKRKISEHQKNNLENSERLREFGRLQAKLNIGSVASKETRDKLSKASLGKPKSDEHRYNLSKTKKEQGYPDHLRGFNEDKSIELTLINPDGELITRSSIREFSIEFGLDRKSIWCLRNNEIRQTKGWTLPLESR